MNKTVDGRPSKAFFVSMLTRDISLQDAVLDLLDNCVDGVIRSLDSAGQDSEVGDKPYKGFWAEITMRRDRFEIRDNCGGISRKKAESKAFRLGRPPTDKPDELPTVGVYGIGMKRAIFKMAETAHVLSRYKKESFRVDISSEWLLNDALWKLPIKDKKNLLDEAGVAVVVDRLRPEVAEKFADTEGFHEQFKKYVAQHFALIIAKGLKVSVNGTVIQPEKLALLTSAKGEKGQANHLAPYVFKAAINGVDVEMYCGLYRQLPDEDEIDEEMETRGSKDDAGWTIVCNDRVVVFRDKSRLTGWGEGGVPNYHSQFIAITGIVVLHAKKVDALPLTTTKRGIDGGSLVYLAVREQMGLATRHFTSFTNKWKKDPAHLQDLYKAATLRSLLELRSLSRQLPYNEVRKIPGAQRFVPDLPLPVKESPDVRLSFTKPRHKVNLLGGHFDSGELTASEIGSEAFDYAFKKLVGRS